MFGLQLKQPIAHVLAVSWPVVQCSEDVYVMVISYVYLIENIKRRRHDNTEERKKTINMIQAINVHKEKENPMTKYANHDRLFHLERDEKHADEGM